MPVLAADVANSMATLLWGGAAVVIVCAAVGGFVCGLVCAPWIQEWTVRRATRHIHRMCRLVLSELERSQRMCSDLAAAPNCALSADEWQRLDGVRQHLEQTFSRLAQTCGMESQPAKSDARPHEFEVEWIKSPVDPASGWPALPAFEQNLALLLTKTAESQLESGLLLVRMDNADGLRRRLGAPAVEKLLMRLGSVIIRSARDRDLACRLNGDTLALMFPALPPLAGGKLADGIRESVRNARLRVEETGAEVLVTASFGYANCLPGDAAQLVRDRAWDALCRSQALGRNQLHLHDGKRIAAAVTAGNVAAAVG